MKIGDITMFANGSTIEIVGPLPTYRGKRGVSMAFTTWSNVKVDHVSFSKMVEIILDDILFAKEWQHTFYWFNRGMGTYYEIVELDLLRGRFVTEDGDWQSFDWECNESHIYMTTSVEEEEGEEP